MRYAATGIFGYDFVDEQGQIVGGTSTIVAPNPPVYIRGYGYEFVSQMNENGYICIEDKDKRIVAYVQQLEQNKYSIHFYDLVLCVTVDEVSYKISHDDKSVILMGRDMKDKGFHINVFDELDIAICLIVFAIPIIIN